MTGQLDLLATAPTPVRPTAPATLLVLEALEDGPKCGLWFMRTHGMGRAAARVAELRDAGWNIDTRWGCACGRHTRQTKAPYYRLVVSS